MSLLKPTTSLNPQGARDFFIFIIYYEIKNYDLNVLSDDVKPPKRNDVK